MILLQGFYESPEPKRQEEIVIAKQHNKKYFDAIEIVDIPNRRCQYSDLIKLANEKYKNEICVIANNDIMFNNDISVFKFMLEDNTIITLTRYDENELSKEGVSINGDFYSYSQDAWVFRAGTLNDFNSEFALGIPKCDNRLLFEAVTRNIKVINPSLDIKTIHNHKSGIRTWNEKDAYNGPLCFPKVTTLRKANKTDVIIENKAGRFFWKKNKTDNSILDIDEFIQYNSNISYENFDYKFYLSFYNLKDRFYQPYCKEKKISNEKIAYYHYSIYGVYGDFCINKNQLFEKQINQKVNLKYIQKDIEKFIPPHEQYKEQYEKHCDSGKKITENSKIAVVSLARNCEKSLMKSIDLIQTVSCKDLKMFIFENDSTDQTKSILKKASDKYSNLEVKSIDNNREHLVDRSKDRTSSLAEYRNVCLDWVKSKCDGYDYVIALDLDPDLGFSINGIYNSVSWLNCLDKAAGLGSYSLYFNFTKNSLDFVHYDSFAVRLSDWIDSNESDNNNKWFRYLHPPVGSNPIHMNSCFGGLAIYKKDVFVKGKYGSTLGSEHVDFHKSLYDQGYKMFLNPSSIFFAVFSGGDFL